MHTLYHKHHLQEPQAMIFQVKAGKSSQVKMIFDYSAERLLTSSHALQNLMPTSIAADTVHTDRGNSQEVPLYCR